MGSSTGTWILLGLVASVAALASAANIPQSDEQTIHRNNGNTFLSNGAGQIFRRADGKTVLKGADGRTIVTDSADSDEDDSLDFSGPSGGSSNTVIINGKRVSGSGGSNNNIIINGEHGSSVIQSDGHNFIYGDGGQGSHLSSNGHSVRIINGAIELTEHGQVYTFKPKPGVNQKETVTINGQPAQVEYSNGDIIIELADHTVIAKVGNRTFLGDRYSFDNRDKLEKEANQYANRIQHEVAASLKKTMADLNAELHHSLGNLFKD